MTDMSNLELIKELYERIKQEKIIIRVRKWKSKFSGLGKVKVIFISSKNDTKNFLISHPTEGQELYLDGRLTL